MSGRRPFAVIADRPTPEQAQVLICDAAGLIAELLDSHENKNQSEPVRGHSEKDRRPQEEDGEALAWPTMGTTEQTRTRTQHASGR